jgi:hypothetical protein
LHGVTRLSDTWAAWLALREGFTTGVRGASVQNQYVVIAVAGLG